MPFAIMHLDIGNIILYSIKYSMLFVDFSFEKNIIGRKEEGGGVKLQLHGKKIKLLSL